MERRRKHTNRLIRGGLNEEAAKNTPNSNLSDLPYVNEIIELGGISIRIVPPVTECVAVAHEGRHTLAMLVRRKGETPTQLLTGRIQARSGPFPDKQGKPIPCSG